MRKLAFAWAVAALYFGFSTPTHAQNLVLNPSFEEIDSCPSTVSQLRFAKHWSNPTSASPDLLHKCNSISNGGYLSSLLDTTYQKVYHGQGMAGIYLYWQDNILPPDYNYREYIQGRLIQPLLAGKQYQVGFYIQPASGNNYLAYATNNIGVFISMLPIENTFYYDENYDDFFPFEWILPYSPTFNHSYIVSDTTQFTRISWEYTALGGEQYLTIGNFYPNNMTDTLNIKNYYGPISREGYYVVDNVFVIPKESSSISENAFFNGINIYPNPASTNLSFSLPYTFLPAQAKMVNTLGATVWEYTLTQPETTIPTGHLPTGVYGLILSHAEQTYTHKVFIQQP